MEIENEFTVPAPVEDLWSYLLDVERIAPCMPGGELTEIVDDHTWKGKVLMKLGPVSLSFAGTVVIEERDDVAHRVKLRAKAMEQKGKGAANASVTSWLEPAGEQTTVKMRADIQLTGAVAQLSRGLLPDVSRRLTKQFAECLHETILADHAVAAPELSTGDRPPAATVAATPAAAARPAVAAQPIGGIRLGLAAIWAGIAGFFRRLLGGRRA